MPPHWLHAGPRSRPCRRAGTTGGESVNDAAAGVEAGVLGAAASGPDALAEGVLGEADPDSPFPPEALATSDDSSPSAGPAGSGAVTDWAGCWAARRARTRRGRVPSPPV